MVGGIPGAFIGTIAGMLTGRPLAGMITGLAVYILSWVMLAAGAALAGQEALARIRRISAAMRNIRVFRRSGKGNAA